MRTEELWTRGPRQLRIQPQAVAEGIKTHLEKHTHENHNVLYCSPRTRPLRLFVIFQHLKILHYPKMTTCVVSLNIQMYLKGREYLVDPKHNREPFRFQTANTTCFQT